MNRHTTTATALAAGALVALAACAPAEQPTPTETTTTATTTAAGDAATVTKVVDGDTFHVQQNGTDVTIRVLAIDTPETVDPSRPDGCYGKEASGHAKTLLTGKTVNLAPDPTQDDKDRYGRALRYVQVDRQDYGLVMVTGGYAKAYKLSRGPAPQRYADYAAAQATATAAHVGMWAAC